MSTIMGRTWTFDQLESFSSILLRKLKEGAREVLADYSGDMIREMAKDWKRSMTVSNSKRHLWT